MIDGKPEVSMERKDYLEQVIVSSLLSNPSHFYEVKSILDHQDFSNEKYKMVFNAFYFAFQNDPDANNLIYKCSEILEKQSEHDIKEVQEILSSLMMSGSLVSKKNFIGICQDLKKLSNASKLSEIYKKYSDMYSKVLTTSDLEEINKEFNQEVAQIVDRFEIRRQEWNLDEITEEFLQDVENDMKEEDERHTVSTGITDLDRYLPDLAKPLLVVIAGRPGMGKTAFSLNLFYNMCKDFKQEAIKKNKKPKKVSYITMEMDGKSLIERVVSFMTGFPVENMSRSNYTKYDLKDIQKLTKEQKMDVNSQSFKEIKKAADILADLNASLYDPVEKTVASVRDFIKRESYKDEMGAIIIDYLGLMDAVGKKSQNNQVQAIQELTAGLKSLAKEFNVPVFLLCQLSRASEHRQDKRPELSDLRDSGSIEQDADAVMFLYREEYYLTKTPESPSDYEKLEKAKNKCTALVKKNRYGRVGEVEMYFEKETNKFSNLAKKY